MASGMTAIEIEPFRVDPVMPKRLSMSYLRSAGLCLRRAHHERIQDSAGEDAIIGHVFHEIADKVGWSTAMRGHTTPDFVEVERIARQILRHPEEIDPLSKHVWDEVLALVGRWMLTAEFHPEERFELAMRQKIHGEIVSARIDRLRIDTVDNVAIVKDYKTGWADPPQKPEPTPQGDIYALLAYYAHPYLDGVWFEEDHVRFGWAGQPFFYGVDAIAEIDAWLGDEIARIRSAYAAGGELPASPGDACFKFRACPVADSCPAKAWARPSTTVRTADKALEEFIALMVEEGSVKELRDRIRAWHERESLLALVTSEPDAVIDFAAMVAAEASVAKRKTAIRGWIAWAGRRAVQLNGQELGYSVDASASTDWKAIALSTPEGADAEVIAAHTKPKSPSYGRRKAR